MQGMGMTLAVFKRKIVYAGKQVLMKSLEGWRSRLWLGLQQRCFCSPEVKKIGRRSPETTVFKSVPICSSAGLRSFSTPAKLEIVHRNSSPCLGATAEVARPGYLGLCCLPDVTPGHLETRVRTLVWSPRRKKNPLCFLLAVNTRRIGLELPEAILTSVRSENEASAQWRTESVRELEKAWSPRHLFTVQRGRKQKLGAAKTLTQGPRLTQQNWNLKPGD
ncbi:uncharacterized protein LOC122901130 isoform X2 [Neovison vison]|uniref:uncharacterized protein LOC122901130 isoform X2 n=1 Tax=Neovison vison TaxID=452646 RepID=UPI001CF00269|nr:uncharacterized protein LOC122901130 isoform X2 [Neogale vison]